MTSHDSALLSDDEDTEAEGPGTMLSETKWCSLRRIQGLHVFQEEGADLPGPAFMATVLVRARPQDVFAVLLREWKCASPYLVTSWKSSSTDDTIPRDANHLLHIGGVEGTYRMHPCICGMWKRSLRPAC